MVRERIWYGVGLLFFLVCLWQDVCLVGDLLEDLLEDLLVDLLLCLLLSLGLLVLCLFCLWLLMYLVLHTAEKCPVPWHL